MERMIDRTTSQDELIAECLKVITRYTQAERTYLQFFIQDWPYDQTVFASPPQPVSRIVRIDDPWWTRQLRGGSILRIESLQSLPPEVEPEGRLLVERGTRNLTLLPVYDGKRMAGILRLENTPANQVLDSTHIELIQIACQLILRVLRTNEELAELKREKSRLAYENWHDERTGLPNRSQFVERLRRAFDRRGRLFAVLVFSFDYFQLIQQRFGFEAGDQMLTAALGRIQSGLRAGDLLARLNDDQFAILLEDVFERGYAEQVAQRILERISRPFLIGDQDVTVTASIGFSMRNTNQKQPETILQEALIAMSQSRRLGRGRFLCFSDGMRDRLIEKMEVENDLRSSIDNQQLILHYQPITEMDTGRIIGFEALVRWQHPARGLVWPLDFIHLSEETGLILPLGRWVLREACRQLKGWQEVYRFDPPLMISVNISARQLSQPDFGQQVENILYETGLPAKSLRLEITESIVIENSCSMMAVLDYLRNLGVQLYIDDFGTGYSSLGYLDCLPVDAIKIDRSFVSNMSKARSSMGVVQAIIQLAHDLNLVVVAEGVETPEQHNELKRMHCEFAQGFFVSEPLEPSGVEDFISRNSKMARVYV